MEPGKNQAQDFEALEKRHKVLEKKKITAEANLETSKGTLEQLKKEAREKYGTDDLAQLHAMLEEMTRENEDKRAKYQEHLTAIETQLAEVEAQHDDAASKEAPA